MDFTSKEILLGVLGIMMVLLAYIFGLEKRNILARLDGHDKKMSEHDIQLKEINDMQKNVIDSIKNSPDIFAGMVKGYIRESLKK